MEPGGDPFKFMMEVDRLAANLHRLGDKSITELRKCVIIVSGLSADFEMECRILENNPAGLNRADIERVVGNQYNRLLRQQQDSKALSASKGTVTANRGKGKNRKLHHRFDGNCFNCGKKGHRAGDCRSAKKKSEKSVAADDKKEGSGSGNCYICGSEEHLAHRHCGLCKSPEHRTRDCEERGAEKGVLLEKLTVPAVPEVRAVAAMVGAARSDRKEEWESDSGATFHMSHTRAGMSAYKKASPGTNVEIADGNILPVDGFGRIEVDLDQPGHTTKIAKMDDIAYVPGLSRNLLSTIKAVEQWGKPLIYYRNRAVLGFPGEESFLFKSFPRKGLFSATGARQIPRKEVALGANLTENGLVRIASGTALAMRAGVSRDVMEVHRMLAHPSEDTTRKTAEMIGIETTGQWGACETCFQAKVKRHAVPKKTDERASVRTGKIAERQAVQWVDGPKKSGGDGTGSNDRGMKSAGDGIIVERGTPQLNVQELGQEQQLTLHEHETQEAFSEHEGKTQGALSELEAETQEALSEYEREQQHEEWQAEPASGSANLEGPALPALSKLPIDGNISPILSSRTRSRRPHTGVEGKTLHCFLPAIEAEEENGVEDALACDDGGQMAMQATLDIPEPKNRRQAMESTEWDEWRKAEETEMLGMVENCVYKQVARPKDKLVVGTKMLYKRKIGQDGKVEKYKCRLVVQGFWQVEGIHYTEKYSPTPATASSRILLAVAAAKDGELCHFDAEQAFLKANIDEEIYIEIPKEFQESPSAVGRLNKAIYGLVQAGRGWNNKFCDDLTAIGFEQAKADPCVFRKVVDGEAEMVVVVHVDDILAHAKDQATMNRFAAELGQKLKLKDMGDAGYYMGCHITRNRKARELKLDQHLYVESMVKRFDVKKATKITAASGVPSLSKAVEPQNPEKKEETRKFPYREAVEALMRTATMTRPDIACAVRAVARFCENPGPAHKKAVMKILQYLLHRKEWGITYGGQGCGLCMEAYTDSDFGAYAARSCQA